MAEESRVPTAPIAHPSDRRDRLSSPASFSYVFCSFSLFLRLFESSPFFLLSARRPLSNTILENTQKHSVRPRTYERYEAIVRLHIVSEFGRYYVQKLTVQHVEAFYTKMIAFLNSETFPRMS